MSREDVRPSVHRTARIGVAAAFVLIVAGGLVTSRDAGLAVPDWPLAYGELNPPGWWRIENVRTEHLHRIIAFLVASWTAFLLWQVWRHPDTLTRRLGFAAAALVLVQALLGGLRVLHLSLDLAMVHGLVGQMYFASMIAVATVTAPGWSDAREPVAATDRTLAAMLLAAVVAQLGLGIFIRHLGVSVRPLAGSALYYSHVVLAGLVLCLVLELRRRAQALSEEVELPCTRLLVSLMAVQIVLGIGSFIVTESMEYDRQATVLEAWLPTLHVACGAAILGATVVLNLHAARSALGVRPLPATAPERGLAA
ncbi:MAG TPA: COX15/CtaA family protein [Candidatus Limnocylindrales bacterium]|nr:COX15/CtaA family protein [Candidatus Limnocylindrales bacterium]